MNRVMKIEAFKCSEDESRIEDFRQIIEDQQLKSEQYVEKERAYRTRYVNKLHSDFVLYPWQNNCYENGYVFVAYEKTKTHTIMLGWMLVHIREFSKLRYGTLTVAHVDYISTNQNIGKGVGKMMMTVMKNKMKELDCHVIELMPLPLVVGFYTKLGYVLEFKKVNYYTKWLKPRPTERLVQLYEHQLNIEDEKIAARIEQEEKEAFQPIYEKFTEEEKERYHKMQHEDDSTRIAMIMTYEESGHDIHEVKTMMK